MIKPHRIRALILLSLIVGAALAQGLAFIPNPAMTPVAVFLAILAVAGYFYFPAKTTGPGVGEASGKPEAPSRWRTVSGIVEKWCGFAIGVAIVFSCLFVTLPYLFTALNGAQTAEDYAVKSIQHPNAPFCGNALELAGPGKVYGTICVDEAVANSGLVPGDTVKLDGRRSVLGFRIESVHHVAAAAPAIPPSPWWGFATFFGRDLPLLYAAVATFWTCIIDIRGRSTYSGAKNAAGKVDPALAYSLKRTPAKFLFLLMVKFGSGIFLLGCIATRFFAA